MSFHESGAVSWTGSQGMRYKYTFLVHVVRVHSAELTLVAYRPDRVYCKETNKDTDRLLFYGEPTPEAIGKGCTRILRSEITLNDASIEA